MVKKGDRIECEWCGKFIGVYEMGRPKKYCCYEHNENHFYWRHPERKNTYQRKHYMNKYYTNPEFRAKEIQRLIDYGKMKRKLDKLKDELHATADN